MNDQERMVAEMWLAGVPVETIAGRVGLCTKAIYKWRQRLNLPPRPKIVKDLVPDPTPEEMEERKRECRERHYAKRLGETPDETRKRLWQEEQRERLRA